MFKYLYLIFFSLLLPFSVFSQVNDKNVVSIEFLKNNGSSRNEILQVWFNKTSCISKTKDLISARDWPRFQNKKYKNTVDSLFDDSQIKEFDSKGLNKSINRTIYYKNIANSFFNVTKFDGLGKKYCINDTVTNINWELLSDTISILGINCQKAKFKFKSGQIGFAWFASKYPYPFGPDKFGGLPGIILKVESQDGRYLIEAVKILFPDTTIQSISPCAFGLNISNQQFNELIQKQNQDIYKMIDQLKTSNKQ
jgi:GLPGLI family protein